MLYKGVLSFLGLNFWLLSIFTSTFFIPLRGFSKYITFSFAFIVISVLRSDSFGSWQILICRIFSLIRSIWYIIASSLWLLGRSYIIMGLLWNIWAQIRLHFSFRWLNSFFTFWFGNLWLRAISKMCACSFFFSIFLLLKLFHSLLPFFLQFFNFPFLQLINILYRLWFIHHNIKCIVFLLLFLKYFHRLFLIHC